MLIPIIIRNLAAEKVHTLLIIAMEKKNMGYCVILAGGKGRRLWPSSRDSYPKQFIDFFGIGRSQLQITYDRFANILPKENIIVTTNKEYADMVRLQLPDMPEENLIAEPICRNTAPSVSWAVAAIAKRNPDAVVVVTPSDQFVLNDDAFTKNVLEGLQLVSNREAILTMGVKPSRPEPGYGYIQMGEPTGEEDVYHVMSFTEKPERDFAKMFMDSGEFLWNTGLFLSNVNYFRKCFHQVYPEVANAIAAMPGGSNFDNALKFCQQSYGSFPNLSIDYAILENCSEVYVMKCDFGWADLGTWHSIYECLNRAKGDNVVIDSTVMMENCKNNVIKLPKGKLAVLNGLEGFIVAEKDNVLLICKKEDTSGQIRKYVNEAQLKYGEEFV